MSEGLFWNCKGCIQENLFYERVLGSAVGRSLLGASRNTGLLPHGMAFQPVSAVRVFT